jgi:O-antigen biosynthesis protein
MSEMKSDIFSLANKFLESKSIIEALVIYKRLMKSAPYFWPYKSNASLCIRLLNKLKNDNLHQLHTEQVVYEKNKYLDMSSLQNYSKFNFINLSENEIDQNFNLLIVKPSGIGNMLLFIPTLQHIIKHYKKANISIICHKADAIALSGLPVEIILFPKIEDIDRRQKYFEEILASSEFKLVIYPPYTALKAPSDNYGAIHVEHPEINFEERHEGLHNLEMLQLIGINAEFNLDIKSKGNISHTRRANKKSFVIHAGSSNSSHMKKKRWPAIYWAELAEKLSALAPVIFVGGEEDEEEIKIIISHICSNNFQVHDAINLFTWDELIAVISNATVFISNDSGIMHLAATTDTPIVAIFGPTNPIKNSPFRISNVSVMTPPKFVECAPCYKARSKKLWSCNDIQCLQNIKPDEVFDTIKKYLV